MPDYLYEVRVYAEVMLVPRGGFGSTVAPSGPGSQLPGAPPLGYAQANIPGFGPTQTPGIAPMGQLMRKQQSEMVGNAITTPPTAANIGAALTAAATDLQNQFTAADIATIGNWALGQQ